MLQPALPDSAQPLRRDRTGGLEGIGLIGRDFGRAHSRRLNQRRHSFFLGRPGVMATSDDRS